MSGLVTRCLLTSARAASTRRLLAPGASRLMSSSGPASPFGEAYFKLRGYNQYGLLHDDILAPSDTVEKAVTRLPDDLQVQTVSPDNKKACAPHGIT